MATSPKHRTFKTRDEFTAAFLAHCEQLFRKDFGVPFDVSHWRTTKVAFLGAPAVVSGADLEKRLQHEKAVARALLGAIDELEQLETSHGIVEQAFDDSHWFESEALGDDARVITKFLGKTLKALRDGLASEFNDANLERQLRNAVLPNSGKTRSIDGRIDFVKAAMVEHRKCREGEPCTVFNRPFKEKCPTSREIVLALILDRRALPGWYEGWNELESAAEFPRIIETGRQLLRKTRESFLNSRR